MISKQELETDYLNYNLFHKFIKTYSPVGFKEINPNDPLMLELEAMMEKHKQFFYVGDILNFKILYTSKGCLEMTGIESAELSCHHLFELIQKDEYDRFSAGRPVLFKLSQDLYKQEGGCSTLASTFKLRHASGTSINVLFQHYLFFQEYPVKTVYLLKVHTDIDWIKKIKNGYYYYYGKDLSLFRYPDEKMLNQGHVFSAREFEIIRLVGQGLNSLQIGDKLFLSPHTVNKHRRNILNKSGMTHVSDLVFHLKEQGLL
jgi:DNA-binding CsgD family transcriptional regulator